MSLNEVVQHYDIMVERQIIGPLLYGMSKIRNLLTRGARLPRSPWYQPWDGRSRVPLGSSLVQQSVAAQYANQMGSNVKNWIPLKESSRDFRLGCLRTPYSPTPTKLIPGSTI